MKKKLYEFCSYPKIVTEKRYLVILTKTCRVKRLVCFCFKWVIEVSEPFLNFFFTSVDNRWEEFKIR